MRMKTAILVIAVMVLGADAQDERKDGKDQKAIQGKWRSESSISDGEKRDPEKQWTVLVIEDNKLSWENSIIEGDLGKTGVVPMSFQLDSSKEPKTIDLTWSEGAYKGKKQLGIYSIKGDTLTICVGSIDKERPKMFKSEKGAVNWLLTLNRLKE
jgi:uncharacterized protein (TIGR03067 family)